MDIYTTSLTLPRHAVHHQLSPSSSFDGDGAGADSKRDSTSKQARAAVAGTSPTSSSATPQPRGSSSPISSRKPSNAYDGSPLSSTAHQPRASLSSSSDGTAPESETGTGDRSSTAASSVLTESTTTTNRHHRARYDGAGSSTESHPSSGSSSFARGSVDLTDAMQRLCVDAMAAHQCLVSFTPVDGTVPPTSPTSSSTHPPSPGSTAATASGPSGKYNFHVSGGYQQVMNARGNLLRDNPFKRTSIVKVPRAEVLDGRGNVKVEMRRKLDEIASLTKAHLAIVGQVAASIGFGLETERNVEIVITGSYESVEQGRVRLLVLLDELSGLHSEVCEIDYKLHNIIAGRKRCVVQTIQEETATNIYFPTSLSGVLGQKNVSLLTKQNLIFITGEFFGVQRARDMLFQVSLHKSKCIISRDTAILPRKLDWMLMDRLEDIKQIMNDNGTFINFPLIGSQASMISVYGDHRVNIERSIRAIMSLACQFYVASFWLLPITFDVFMPPPSLNPAQIPSILRHIAVTSGAEAVFKSNCFEFHGLESEIRAAVQIVLELHFIKQFHHEMRFQIELANEHRDFISGKKNGKLNKIMKSADVKIKFETFNDYNFLIDVAGHDLGALHGLTMLQEELPAEISFHVPEAYHKRIIGVGGKNIQRIMKKYGVYVKFSNAEEFALLGGYADNEDNVIARTPAKNAINLEHLKQAVMELVSPKDKDFVIETVSIPRRYHRTLLGEKSIFIHDIEAKTNSAVRFPNKESASDVVSIFGPESQVHIAAQMLLDHVPFEAEYRLPYSPEIAALTLSQDFVGLTERIKRDLNITILPWVDRTGASEEATIRFCLNRSNVDFLATARDIVEEYLVKRNIKLFPGSLRPRSDSIANAFPFFNSKLLPSNDARQKANASSDHKLRFAASTPNIKAIFDGPGVSASSPTNNSANAFAYRSADQDYPGFYPPSTSPPRAVQAAFPTSQGQGQAMPLPAASSSTAYHRGWGTMPRATPIGSNPRFGLPSSGFFGSGFPKSSSSSRLSQDDASLTRSTVSHHHPSPSDVGPKISHGPSASVSAGIGSALDEDKMGRAGLGHHRPRGLAQSFDLGLHAPAHRKRAIHQSHESVDEVGNAFSSLGF